METKEKNQTQSSSFKVSESVISKIAALAAGEVAGVALEVDEKRGKRLARADGLKFLDMLFGAPTVKVKLFKEAAEIEIVVVALQSYNAATVGENIQKAVKSAVQNMTGIPVSKVNVTFAGIVLPLH